jgi:hypothetical protein
LGSSERSDITGEGAGRHSVRSGFIGDQELLIFSCFVFGVGKIKDRVIESRIKPVLAFGVTVQDMVATSYVHGNLGDSNS